MKKHKLTGEGGKGSTRRTANEQAYADNWETIFGNKKPNPPTEPNPPKEKEKK
jgi:hypothetical protein